MSTSKRPAFRKNDPVTLSRIKRPIPAYAGKPFVGRDMVLTVSHITGTGAKRNPWGVVVTNGTHFWHLEPGDVMPAETQVPVCTGCRQPAHASETDDAGYHPGCAPTGHSTKKHLDNWLDQHGYRHAHARKQKTPHTYAASSRLNYGESERQLTNEEIRRYERSANPFSRSLALSALAGSNAARGRLTQEIESHGYHHGHARIIHQPPTGRAVFATHERDHHITTSGRRALDQANFALPPGPEEKRRGIKGRLPIDTIARARNALQRAIQMLKRKHITVGELAEVQRAVQRAWPSIEVHEHSHATIAKEVRLGDKFRHEGGIWQVTRISGGKITMTSEVADPRDPFNFEKFILIERTWPQSALRKMVKMQQGA